MAIDDRPGIAGILNLFQNLFTSPGHLVLQVLGIVLNLHMVDSMVSHQQAGLNRLSNLGQIRAEGMHDAVILLSLGLAGA